jgi:PAS domain S-box-containing protein
MITAEELKRLRESEERYRKMIERANDAILTIDVENGTIVEVNPKAVAMTGYSAEELRGMTVWMLHPEEEVEEARRLFDKVAREGEGYHCELHFRRKDGSKLAVDVRSSVIEYADKRVIQRICRDVTRQRKLQLENEYLRKYYEKILDMMPVGLGVKRDVSRRPVIEFENKKLREMLHEADGEGMHWYWHDDPSSNKKQNVFTSQGGCCCEEKESPDGRVFLITSNYFRNNGIWYAVEIVQDITELKQLERQLQAANEELEAKVEQRTRELREKQAQLVQSEKMAALGQLVAGVAHEINTPLGALNSNNDVFLRSFRRLRKTIEEVQEKGTLDEAMSLLSVVEGLLEVNKTAYERIVKIVKTLRKFARLDEAELAWADLHEGLENTLILVHHEIKNRILVHRQYGEIPKVKCFPNKLNQVFMNLLVNAAHAIEGKGEIHITTSHTEGWVTVEIRDTGRGIPQENLTRIFDPGFTTKGSGVGSGLGLAIVYQIIEEHRGRIEVQSEPGHGTTFRIHLPVQ